MIAAGCLPIAGHSLADIICGGFSRGRGKEKDAIIWAPRHAIIHGRLVIQTPKAMHRIPLHTPTDLIAARLPDAVPAAKTLGRGERRQRRPAAPAVHVGAGVFSAPPARRSVQRRARRRGWARLRSIAWSSRLRRFESGPVVLTLLIDREVNAHYRTGRVVTTVDCVTAAPTLARSMESRRQVWLADRLVLTKTDLAAASDRLLSLLATLNRDAPVTCNSGRLDAARLFGPCNEIDLITPARRTAGHEGVGHRCRW